MTSSGPTTNWTERYLAAALGSIPESKRTDVERELRSSIDDAIEERVTTDHDRVAAERSVLEGLGDPAQLAAGYTGRPQYLIGPELFPIYRRFVPRLIAVVVPIAATVLALVKLAAGGGFDDAIGAAISGAINVTIGIAFWTTLTFVFLERADAARAARTELVEKTGKWTLEKLPDKTPGRPTASGTVGEVITALITIGGLLFARSLSVPDGSGAEVSLLDPALTGFWFPVFIGVLLSIAVLHVVVFAVGRWTIPLAIGHAVLQLGFAVPIVWLALTGTLVSPAFAAQVGWPPLAERDGVVMVAIAIGTTLVTAWEIISVFLQARGTPMSWRLFWPSRYSI